jgi:hypothetical protein
VVIEVRAGGALAELVDAGCSHAFILLCVHYSSLRHFYISLQKHTFYFSETAANGGLLVPRITSTILSMLTTIITTITYHHNHAQKTIIIIAVNATAIAKLKLSHHRRSYRKSTDQLQHPQPFFLKANVRRRPSTRRYVDFTHCHVKSLTK